MRAIVLGVLLLAPLTGCVDDATPVDPALGPGGNLTEAGVPEDKALPDGRNGTFSAFQETNRTSEGIDGKMHDHDYWKGRDRVDVIDRAESTSSWYYLDQYTQGTARPEKDDLVFEGTSIVEVLAASPRYQFLEAQPPVPHPSPPPVKLEYRHAAASEWIDLGPIVWGTPLEIKVEPDQTDMPHTVYSLWEFRFTSEFQTWVMEFDFKVTIVRGKDVPEWPGHPLFYADGHDRLIYAGAAKTKDTGAVGAFTNSPDEYTQAEPNRLVSYGTKAVHVFVNATKITAPPGATFAKWDLRYTNASGIPLAVDPVTLPADPANPKDLHFQIPVDDNAMDSPYAAASRWQFALRGYMETPDPTGQAITIGLFGFVEYEVEYEIRIVATDVPLPETEETA